MTKTAWPSPWDNFNSGMVSCFTIIVNDLDIDIYKAFNMDKREFQTVVFSVYQETEDPKVAFEVAFEQAGGVWGTDDEEKFGSWFDEIAENLI